MTSTQTDPSAGRAEGPPRGARLPRSARRQQLLGAAQEVFVQHGYHAAAMDEIAERAGVSKPVLYQHFPGKLELYLALLDTHCETLVTRVREALAATTDNRARVVACVSTYFDFVDGQGTATEGAFRLLFESDLRSEPAVRQKVEEMNRRCIEAVAETIAHDTGYRAEEALVMSSGVVGLCEVGARWWLASEGAVSKERAVELLVGLSWRGLAGAPRTGVDPSADSGSGRPA